MGFALIPFALIWCGVVTSLFLGLRWISGELRDATSRASMLVLYSLMLALALLGPFQATSPWKFALPFPPALIYGLSAFAWIALLAVLAAEKAASMQAWVLGLIVAVCSLPLGPFVGIWLLFQPDPDLRGRISATLTYEVSSTQAWGGGRQYTYRIYRNPRSMAWIRRKAAEDEVPCTPSDILFDPWRFQPGPQDRTVVISCHVLQAGRYRVDRKEVSVR